VVSGYQFVVSGYRFVVSGYRLVVSGYRFVVSGYRFVCQVTDLWCQVTDLMDLQVKSLRFVGCPRMVELVLLPNYLVIFYKALCIHNIG